MVDKISVGTGVTTVMMMTMMVMMSCTLKRVCVENFRWHRHSTC